VPLVYYLGSGSLAILRVSEVVGYQYMASMLSPSFTFRTRQVLVIKAESIGTVTRRSVVGLYMSAGESGA